MSRVIDVIFLGQLTYINTRHFTLDGLIGRLLFQVHDLKTGAFLGKDAYEISRDLATFTYECKKVLYGPHD